MKNYFGKIRSRKGQGLVEYGILVGGVALICLASVAILGHKSNDLIASVAAILPCAHDDAAGPIVSGKLIATTVSGGGLIVDVTANGDTLADRTGIVSLDTLVVEAD